MLRCQHYLTKHKILWMGGMIFLFIQCQKEPIIAPAGHSLPLKSVQTYMANDMLVFPDYATFDSTMNVVYSYESSGLHYWEQSKGFYSMRAYYNDNETQIIDSTNWPSVTDTIMSPIEDDCLAAVLSPNGFIQIGDTVYQFTHDTTYAYMDNALISGFPVKREKIHRTDEPGVLSCEDESNYDINVETTSFQTTSDNGILETYTWATRFSFFYASTGVTVTHYHETSYYFQGAWRTYLKQTPANYLRLEWRVCSIEGYWGYPESHLGSLEQWGQSRLTAVIRKVAFADVGVKGIYSSEYNNDTYMDKVVTPHYYGF